MSFTKSSPNKKHSFLRKVIYLAIAFSLVTSFLYFQPWLQKARAVNVQIRQEINIIDAYLGSNGVYATSSAIIQIDPAQYSGATYYFEVVASTTTAVSSNIYLKNATSSATVVSINFSNNNTYTLYPSSNFTPPMATQYQVVAGNEGVQKGVIAARIVILQSADPLAKTETQIEIGSNVLATSSIVTTPMSNPKYWYYDDTKWSPAPTFSVEVTYQNYQAASTTVFSTSATTTATTYKVQTVSGISYLQVEAWGAGGGGGVSTAVGGGGGGGGAYAKSIFATSSVNVNTLVVPRGAAIEVDALDATFNYVAGCTSSNCVSADGGVAGVDEVGGTGGTIANSIYNATSTKGGTGGIGDTNHDTSGGGGGAGGPDGPNGAGKDGLAAGHALNNAGGDGDGSSGGAGGAAGAYQAAGYAGISYDQKGGGGGGGGGGNNSNLCGGTGGRPGGGGGGGEGGTTCIGGQGQIKLTETHGNVGIALEEDTDGAFGGWAFKQQIVTAGVSTSSPSRIRVSFTPATGHNYRIVASTTAATASYDIYNAKIIAYQASPTKIEAQYLLANTLLASGTGLQNFLTSWDSSQWVGVSNTYIHEVDAADNSSSVVEIDTAADAQVLGSSVDTPDNREQSSSMTMPATGNLDTQATFNSGDVYASRILVQVSVSGPPTVTTNAATNVTHGSARLNGQIDATGGSDAIEHGFAWGTVANLAGGDTATTTLGAKVGTGTFYSDLIDANINCGTTYYFRAYAQNSTGWGYGSSILNFFSPCPTGATPNKNIKTEIQGGIRFLGGVRFR